MAEHDAFGRQETEVLPQGLSAGDAAARRRRDVEPLPLVAGMLFILVAVLVMSGVGLPLNWFGHGITWLLLIGAGVALLVTELRKARNRR